MTGSGKTFLAKEIVRKANVNKNAILVFDTNNEWKEFYPYPFTPDMDEFLDKAERIQNGLIVIEDATSFIGTHSRSETLIRLLIGKRHSNNTYILLFHAFADLPKYVYRKCTHLVIFKTPDAERHLQAYDNDDLTRIWAEVQNDCKGHKFFSTYPPPKGEIPPSKMFSIY